MGAVASHQKFLDVHGPLLENFVGTKPISPDSYWQELLSFPVPLTKLSPHDLEASALPYCERLVHNNASSNNFQTLLGKALQKLKDVDTAERAQQATNAVLFVRVFFKYLTESLNADDLVAFLDAPIRAAGGTGESWVGRVCKAVTEVLVHVPIREATYLLHLETMHLLLVLISTQLYSPSTSAEPGGHPFLEVLMDSHESAKRLLLVQLQHFVERRQLPARAPVFVPPPTERQGVLRLVRSAAATVLWLPIQALTFLVRSGTQQLAESPLCETGLLLLLALLHHAPVAGHENPFQQALYALQDSGNNGAEDDAEAPSSSGREDGISFHALFEALGQNLTHERSVLLLYDLLHSCPNFRNFAVMQRKLGTILLPLLHMLYSAVGRSASQMYMLLIVVLILSQDPVFSQTIHATSLSSVPWYSERLLKDTSLGSLMVVVLLRTAHYNLSKLKDVYLHTNTLAALANLAPHVSNLTSHAAQRLISLFDMLARRYSRLSAEGKTSDAHETQVYCDFLRIVLEIVNCIVVRGLRRNPELVYALLHRQDVLTSLQGHEQFRELLANLKLVVRFFNSRVDVACGEGHFECSVSNVLQLVKASLEEWPGDNTLTEFPELRFTYEEETHPEGFFVPYVWTLVVSNTTVPWRPQAITLFSPVSLGSDDANLDGLTGARDMGRMPSEDASDAANIV